MPNEKPANVLTEEELKVIEKHLAEFGHIDFQQACKLRNSHRSLNSRNAKLVHENDELMAENVKLNADLEKALSAIQSLENVINSEELNHE